MTGDIEIVYPPDHRNTNPVMLLTGGLQAVAELLSRDSELSAGSDSCSAFSMTLRRYTCMTLTNLTYADSTNKTLLCAMPIVLRALVSQLRSPEEELRQVRNKYRSTFSDFFRLQTVLYSTSICKSK